jgi:hypothetical protein
MPARGSPCPSPSDAAGRLGRRPCGLSGMGEGEGCRDDPGHALPPHALHAVGVISPGGGQRGTPSPVGTNARSRGWLGSTAPSGDPARCAARSRHRVLPPHRHGPRLPSRGWSPPLTAVRLMTPATSVRGGSVSQARQLRRQCVEAWPCSGASFLAFHSGCGTGAGRTVPVRHRGRTSLHPRRPWASIGDWRSSMGASPSAGARAILTRGASA